MPKHQRSSYFMQCLQLRSIVTSERATCFAQAFCSLWPRISSHGITCQPRDPVNLDFLMKFGVSERLLKGNPRSLL